MNCTEPDRRRRRQEQCGFEAIRSRPCPPSPLQTPIAATQLDLGSGMDGRVMVQGKRLPRGQTKIEPRAADHRLQETHRIPGTSRTQYQNSYGVRRRWLGFDLPLSTTCLARPCQPFSMARRAVRRPVASSPTPSTPFRDRETRSSARGEPQWGNT